MFKGSSLGVLTFTAILLLVPVQSFACTTTVTKAEFKVEKKRLKSLKKAEVKDQKAVTGLAKKEASATQRVNSTTSQLDRLAERRDQQLTKAEQTGDIKIGKITAAYVKASNLLAQLVGQVVDCLFNNSCDKIQRKIEQITRKVALLESQRIKAEEQRDAKMDLAVDRYNAGAARINSKLDRLVQSANELTSQLTAAEASLAQSSAARQAQEELVNGLCIG